MAFCPLFLSGALRSRSERAIQLRSSANLARWFESSVREAFHSFLSFACFVHSVGPGEGLQGETAAYEMLDLSEALEKKIHMLIT